MVIWAWGRQIRFRFVETANTTLEGINYDCRVFDSPRDPGATRIVRLNQRQHKQGADRPPAIAGIG